MPVLELLARADTPIHAAGIVERVNAVTVKDYVRVSNVSASPFLPMCGLVHATHHDLSEEFVAGGAVNAPAETKATAEASYMKTSAESSCHFVIGRDLKLYWIVPVTKQAWHAGRAKSPFQNQTSIGIEIHSSVWRKDNKSPWHSSPLLPGQRQILIDLLSLLAWQFSWVGPQNVARHGDAGLPPGRKFDPHCIQPAAFAAILNEVWWFDRPHPATT